MMYYQVFLCISINFIKLPFNYYYYGSPSNTILLVEIDLSSTNSCESHINLVNPYEFRPIGESVTTIVLLLIIIITSQSDRNQLALLIIISVN